VVVVRLNFAVDDALNRSRDLLTVDRKHDCPTNRNVFCYFSYRSESEVFMCWRFSNPNLDLFAFTGSLKSVGVVADVHVVNFAVKQGIDLSSLWQCLENDRVKHWLVTPPLFVTHNGDCSGHFVKSLELEWTGSYQWCCFP